MQQQNPMMGQRMGTPQTQAGPTKPVTQPIILGKDQQMLTDIRYETLDREVNKLAALMEQLVDSSRVMDGTSASTATKYVNKTQNEKDELQISITASSMVDSCQNLLRLVSELESSYLFYEHAFEKNN